MQEFTGTDYVKIDLANQFGLDRLRWQDRIHWVNNNIFDLPSLANTAKNKLAFTKALRAFRSKATGQPTNHIMGLDATASGIQIMSCMSGCRTSAKAVNLVNTGEREDVYLAVANMMVKQTGLEITRNIVKDPVMTFFYGSQAVPKRVFGDKTDQFFNAMKQALPGPYELMSLFQSFWDPGTSNYQWAMPDGHVVHIPVTIKEDKGLEIDEANHMRFTYRAEVVKAQLQGRSLAANIVHSVDGWICREMSKKAEALGFYLAPIHDCFYAHPNHMNKVRQMYRECLAAITEQNLVEAILSQIARRQVVYPKKGDITLDVLNSEYALS